MVGDHERTNEVTGRAIDKGNTIPIFPWIAAQRLLVERGKTDVVPELIALTKDTQLDSVGLNVGAIHALWTLHGLGALDGKDGAALQAAQAVLRHPSAGVRRNAVQVLPRESSTVAAIRDASLLTDKDAQVRLATLLALADLPADASAGEAVVAALASVSNSGDRWIPDAATAAAARHDRYALASLARLTNPNPQQLTLARTVAEHYARGEATETVAELLNQLHDASNDMASTIIDGLASGWPRESRPSLNDPFETSLEKLAEKLPADSRGTLVRLASQWGSQRLERLAEQVATTFLETVGDDSASADKRIDAAKQLIEFRRSNDDVVTSLLEVITPQTQPEVAIGFIRSLQGSDAPGLGDALVERIGELTPAVRQAAVAVMLARPEPTRSLLTAIDTGTVQLDELTLDQKQALAVHPNAEIKSLAKKLLERGGMLPDADRQKVLDELLPITHEKGDPIAGKEVFTKNCGKCHTHSGEGTKIGPDLTGMAVHPKEELLMNVIDPSRSVEGNFRTYTLETNDGQIMTGMLAAESRTAIELIDSEGKRQTILREDIDTLTMSRKSIMPEGFEKQVTKTDLTNLLEFLTKRGKYVPLDLRKVATIASDRGMFFERDGQVERLIFSEWGQKTFEEVPFQVLDPQDGRVPNVVMLHSTNGIIPRSMPKQVALPCNTPVKKLHLLSGISGWGFPASEKGTTSLVVRIKYADGQTEEHELLNGVHFADYIRRIDVPESKFAFQLRGQQVRYLTVEPKRQDMVSEIELVKGSDRSAPIVMAITVETPDGGAAATGQSASTGSSAATK